jgi:parallel beta-helix repeat protein
MKIAALLFWGLLPPGLLPAIEISGTITSTLIINEDSWLVGNVTCRVTGGPCIRVAASNITIWLNGFSLTGQGDPPSGCFEGGPGNNPETGIDVTGQRRVEIFGPGAIDRHRGHGILLGNGTTRARLKDFTLSTNCNSGLQFGAAHDNDIEDLVSVRNGNRQANCGGICITNSNNNRIRGNVTAGNGYAVTNVTNFGIALLGTSRGNTIEHNTSVGNANGIFLQPGVVENVFFQNIIFGNPPLQILLSVEGFPGFDIRSLAPEGSNIFSDNLCTTYSGAGPAPCPNHTRTAGK